MKTKNPVVMTLREFEYLEHQNKVQFFNLSARLENTTQLFKNAPDLLDLTEQEDWKIPGYWDKNGYLCIENPPLWFAQLFHLKKACKFQLDKEYSPLTWEGYLFDSRERLFPGTRNGREALTARAGEKINPTITLIKP